MVEDVDQIKAAYGFSGSSAAIGFLLLLKPRRRMTGAEQFRGGQRNLFGSSGLRVRQRRAPLDEKRASQD